MIENTIRALFVLLANYIAWYLIGDFCTAEWNMRLWCSEVHAMLTLGLLLSTIACYLIMNGNNFWTKGSK